MTSINVWINNIEHNLTLDEWEELDKDKIHRDDGPALIHSDGKERWYKDGKLHREDGPAFINTNGYVEWYYNGKLHREDGPAIEWPQPGLTRWYINGWYITTEIKQWIKENKIDTTTKEGQMALKLRFG